MTKCFVADGAGVRWKRASRDTAVDANMGLASVGCSWNAAWRPDNGRSSDHPGRRPGPIHMPTNPLSRWLAAALAAGYALLIATGADAADLHRRVVPLDGSWQVAEGGMDRPPADFSRVVPVPGLVSLARPAFIDPECAADRRSRARRRDAQDRHGHVRNAGHPQRQGGRGPPAELHAGGFRPPRRAGQRAERAADPGRRRPRRPAPR